MENNEKPIRLILVDDETSFTYFLSNRLRRLGLEVSITETGEAALHELSIKEFDVAVLDMKLPGIGGLDLLQQIKMMLPELEVIMLTGFGSIDSATEAMKRGAYDYLTKPAKAAHLELVIQKAAEKKRLKEQARGLSEALWRQAGNQPIIGQSPGIRQVIEMIRKVADGGAPVLILGESGTGKELVARSLHFWSLRRQKPFQALNTAAIPTSLLESELFGYSKGAFTGATATKVGLVEDADGGTLFLDEIGELDPTIQAKLLRFLESGEFRRVGENLTRKVKVRIVAATNRDLYQDVQEGKFRADLFYRLNVVALQIPPLRERQQDILLLVDYFLKTKSTGRQRKELSSRAKETLLTYDLPGNVRELANLIERGILLSTDKVIEPEHLFFNSTTELLNRTRVTEGELKPYSENGTAIETHPQDNKDMDDHSLNGEEWTLAALERQHIQRVMELTEWKKPRAAQLLGIGLRTLYRKLEEYQLIPEQESSCSEGEE